MIYRKKKHTKLRKNKQTKNKKIQRKKYKKTQNIYESRIKSKIFVE
jgi:hypothetical protein